MARSLTNLDERKHIRITSNEKTPDAQQEAPGAVFENKPESELTAAVQLADQLGETPLGPVSRWKLSNLSSRRVL